MPTRFAAFLLAACLLTPTAFAQDAARRPFRPLLVVQGAETPVRLRDAAIDVDIGAGTADTTVELVFHNPNGRTLEGELQFPLAPGQKVVGFALDIGGEMRAAVPVGKARGRQVFEEIARRGVDPGLLEVTQGDNFKLRVYPLPPRGERRVRLRIAQRLERSGGAWTWRLPVPFAAGVDAWRATARVHGGTVAPTVAGPMTPVAFRRETDGFSADLPRPAGAGAVLALQGRQEAGARSWTGDFEGESYFVADVPVAAAAKPRRLPGSVGLLWDSSGSGATRRHDLEFALLDRYFRAVGSADVSLVRLRDRAEAPRSYRVRGGDWSALRRELEATVYDGATALGGWTPEARVGEYLLFSDGLDNYGAAPFPALGADQRLFAVNAAGGGADSGRLDALAQRHAGRAIDLAGGVEAAARALLADGPRIASLGGEGLAELQAEALDARDGAVRIAGRRLQPDGMLRVTFDDGRKVEVKVNAASPHQPLAPQLWAGWRIDALQPDYALRRGEIARLGKRFGIATRDTSLIVLERLDDYVRYDIAPPPALRAAVAQLGAVRTRRLVEVRERKLERVVRDLDDKLAWWQTRFPAAPPQDPAQPRVGLANHRYKVEVTGSRIAGPLAERAVPVPPAPPAPAPALQNFIAQATDVPATAYHYARAAPLAAKASSADGLTAPPTAIVLGTWTPDGRYVDRMAQANAAQAYAIYQDLKPDFAASTAFYLDVADTLLAKGDRMLALRVLSNLAEMDLENRHVLRVLGYRLLQAGAPELAVPVFEAVLRLAEEEPQSWRDLGLAYAAAGKPQQAIDTLYQVAVREWDGRFPEVELIALADLNAIVAANPGRLDTSRIDPRLLRNMPLDLRVVLTWDADNSDMDLWVTDPDGERCMYSAPLTTLGGRLSRDATGGYGPEEFSLRKAKPGKYKVEANFFGERRQLVTGGTTLQVRLTTGFGTAQAKERLVSLRLRGRGETVFVGEFEVAGSR